MVDKTLEDTVVETAGNESAPIRENPILQQLREASAQQTMITPSEILKEAALKAAGIDGVLDILHPENMPLAQGLKQHGRNLAAATDQYIGLLTQQAGFATRNAVRKLEPKSILAGIAESCNNFLTEHTKYLTAPGASEMIAAANNLRNAATGFLNEYSQYLSIVRKPTHPRVAEVAASDEITR